MTRVNFYLLEGSGERACELFACRLAEKAYRMTHRTFIHTPSAAAAGKVDDLLWTFRDGAFVPHTLADATANADELGLSAVLIGHAAQPTTHTDLLINLAAEVPTFFSRFERVAEVVDTDAARRNQARERFRFYRDRGYPVETHNMSGRGG